MSVSFSPCGGRIASASMDCTIKVWEASTGTCQSTLSGHGDRVLSVCFSPDGKKIASGSWDKTVRIWDAATGAPVGSPLTVDAGECGVFSVSFSPKDNVIAAGCSNGCSIYLVDAQAGEVKSSLTGHSGSVFSVAFSKDGTRLVSGSFDGTVKIWSAGSAGTFECESTLSGHDDGVLSVCFSPDGKKIASGAKDKTVRIWDALTGAPVGSPLSGHWYVPFPCVECLLS